MGCDGHRCCGFIRVLRKVNSLHKEKGTTQTFEPTLFRLELLPGSVILLLVYVDDLLLAASTEEELEELVTLLQKVWKIKVTGSLPWASQVSCSSWVDRS